MAVRVLYGARGSAREVAPQPAKEVGSVSQSTSERLGVEAFQALFDRCSNWGRWGADDERGTLNLIAPEQRIRAAGLVREGVTRALTAGTAVSLRAGARIRLGDRQMTVSREP